MHLSRYSPPNRPQAARSLRRYWGRARSRLAAPKLVAPEWLQSQGLTIPQPDATNYPPARHRTPGDIRSEYRATSSRNARATSSESALLKRPCLDRWQLVIHYLTSAMAFEPREQFRVLYLDKRNNLIDDEVLAEGTVDHTPVYPREVLRRAIELHATPVLVHNHPSGDATPSRADIDMSKQVVEVCGLLGIAVHDHVIIARDGHSSLRGLGLM